MISCAYSLCTCGRRIWESELLRSFSCSVKAQDPNGIDDVGWSWVFDFCFLNDDQLCLFTLRVRASYLREWTFEATCYAQWTPRILMVLRMLAEMAFSIFCLTGWSAVPIHFACAGVVFESLNFWGHFSCSVKAEDPNGIDDVGWSWVFDLFFKWCSAVPFYFARAGVVFESVYVWGSFSCSAKAEDPDGIDDVGWSWVFVCVF